MEHNIFAAVRERVIAALRGVEPGLPHDVAAARRSDPGPLMAHGFPAGAISESRTTPGPCPGHDDDEAEARATTLIPR